MTQSGAPEIFDRHVRRIRRDRALRLPEDGRFLLHWMAEGLAERCATVTRRFGAVLANIPPPADCLAPDARIALFDPGYQPARSLRGVQGDEDRLPFADTAFDLVLSAGTLDQVNDLPGALALTRRVLRPDGLLLAAFVGAGSLPALRTALRAGDGDRPAPRFHPAIDVRAAGDLLVRAGFALPVADVETLDVRYASPAALVGDLRAMAATNLLRSHEPLSPAAWARAERAFADMAEPDGKVRERFSVIFLTGWAPAPEQPRPARRGSGQVSLAEALRRTGA